MLISHLLSRIWKHPISGARFWATPDLDQLLVKGFVKKGFNHGISMALFGASSSAQIFSQQDQQIHSCGCLSPSIWLNIEHGNSSQSPRFTAVQCLRIFLCKNPRKSWGNPKIHGDFHSEQSEVVLMMTPLYSIDAVDPIKFQFATNQRLIVCTSCAACLLSCQGHLPRGIPTQLTNWPKFTYRKCNFMQFSVMGFVVKKWIHEGFRCNI